MMIIITPQVMKDFRMEVKLDLYLMSAFIYKLS